VERTNKLYVHTYIIYKVQVCLVTHIQFIVKNTFKATCFGSTEPSSGLFVRTDQYLITCCLECVFNNKLDVFD